MSTPPPTYFRVRCKHCGEVGALSLEFGKPLGISSNFYISKPKIAPHDPLAITFACVRCRKGLTIDRVIKDPKELKWARQIIGLSYA